MIKKLKFIKWLLCKIPASDVIAIAVGIVTMILTYNAFISVEILNPSNDNVNTPELTMLISVMAGAIAWVAALCLLFVFKRIRELIHMQYTEFEREYNRVYNILKEK